MFSSLTEKLKNAISSFGKQKKLTEENLSEAVREVRLALLEADVNYSVVSNFIKKVKEKAIGEDLLKSVTPTQQFIKIVHDELIELMGSDESPLELKGDLAVILLCGLQGSGKTTHAAKIASYIEKNEKKKVLLAACDLQRPAAVDQLKKLGDAAGISVFSIPGNQNPLAVAKAALTKAKEEKFQVLIVDTAGRLHLDEDLMKELEELKKKLNPQEVLFVANATLGQDAVKTAAEFDKRVSLTGTILSMLDGNARAGAAISIREVTQKPLKFEGVGEKISDLQIFNPRSMADRILGMGDIINLVKKAESAFDEEESLRMQKKLKTATFTYNDYLKQMGMVKKMGSFKSLLGMLPGMSGLGDLDFSDKEFAKTEAIILSMTPKERDERVELDISRKKRIAKGSGVAFDDVNRMVKGFKRIKQMFKGMPNMKGAKDFLGKVPSMDELKKKMGDMKWH
jgi:signal recognition particle subunit SRP54